MVMYGVLGKDDNHIDVSKTLHGAKCYATRNGYSKISKRCEYNITSVWVKIDGKWKFLKEYSL